MRKACISLLFIPCALVISGCTNGQEDSKLSFAKTEYQIHSGDAVKVEQNYQGVKYSFAGEVPTNAKVNEDSGVITFTADTPHYSQVLLVATLDEKQSSPAIVTLLQNNVTTTLSFVTPIKNITSGDYILVNSTNDTAITYSLKNSVLGVSIDSMNGRVSFTSAAVEGSSFTVVASSADQKIEEEYFVAKKNLVKATSSIQSIEIGSNTPATYVLNFDEVIDKEEKVLAVMNGSKSAKESEFHYDAASHTLVVESSFLKTFKTGENKMRIVTPRNMVNVDLIMITKFIKNASDLQGINKNRETLAGYYVLENDIDLTQYLSKGHEGYNDARGWNQIGIYHDLEEDPTRDSFTGTFDGNGHIISGFFEERADDLAHNEGLFGYVTNQAVIKNVGFVGNGTTTGRNFIGGFVGFNEGIIKNCWANVDISNKHEDKLFHSVGAFAGANTGRIESCYTLGTATGDENVGAFIGKNFGEMVNCFSVDKNSNGLIGLEDMSSYVENCATFPSVDQMVKYPFSSCFDNDAWEFSDNNLPVLKHQTEIDAINGIEILNDKSTLIKGDQLEVNVTLHPMELNEQEKGNVVLTLVNAEGSGIVQTGNKFDTSNANVEQFTVTASIHLSYCDYATSKTFTIKPKVESIEFIDDFPTYVEPGKQYQLNVKVTPEDVDPEIEWSFKEEYDGKGRLVNFDRCMSFNRNILTIKENAMNFKTKEDHPTFTVVGVTNNGLKVSKTLKLNRIHYLGNTYCTVEDDETVTQNVIVVYKNSNQEYIQFDLPNQADMDGIAVYRFTTKLSSKEFTKTGHSIKIPLNSISDLPDRQVSFNFRCGSGTSQMLFRGYACYISHNRYQLSDVTEKYTALSSADDFYKYFRLTKEDNNASKWENYDKTYVLTDDIDFKGATDLVAIGYHSSSYPEAKEFIGKIYGFGHKIKKATFHYCERLKFAGPTDQTKKADPNTYRVGFFGYFAGEIYDVVFESITSNAYNYGGCFAGVISSGAYLENITFLNCKAYSVNDVDYTIDDVIEGRVAATNAGTFVAVTYNGTAVGLIGK